MEQKHTFDLKDSRHSIYLSGHAVLVNGNKIGVLNPTIKLGSDKKKFYVLSGIRTFTLKGSNIYDLWKLIEASGGILFGKPSEVDTVETMLNKPEMSRTVAYLCNVAKSCREIIAFENKISKSKVLVLGSGGIGSLITVQIAGFGIQNISICDFDIIEQSNLNRQVLYKLTDIGSKKTEVLNREINARFPKVKMNVFEQNIESNNDLTTLTNTTHFDLAICSIDTPPKIAQLVSNYFSKYKTPVIMTGYTGNNGVVLLNNTDKKDMNSDIIYCRTPNFVAPSLGPLNFEVAGMAANLALHVLIGKEKKTKRMIFNSSKFPR